MKGVQGSTKMGRGGACGAQTQHNRSALGARAMQWGLRHPPAASALPSARPQPRLRSTAALLLATCPRTAREHQKTTGFSRQAKRINAAASLKVQAWKPGMWPRQPRRFLGACAHATQPHAHPPSIRCISACMADIANPQHTQRLTTLSSTPSSTTAAYRRLRAPGASGAPWSMPRKRVKAPLGSDTTCRAAEVAGHSVAGLDFNWNACLLATAAAAADSPALIL